MVTQFDYIIVPCCSQRISLGCPVRLGRRVMHVALQGIGMGLSSIAMLFAALWEKSDRARKRRVRVPL